MSDSVIGGLLLACAVLLPVFTYMIGYERGQAKLWSDVAAKWVEAKRLIYQYDSALKHLQKVERELKGEKPNELS